MPVEVKKIDAFNLTDIFPIFLTIQFVHGV